MMHPPNSTDSQPGIRRKLHLIATVALIGVVSWVLSCSMLRNATIDDPDSALIFSHPDHAIHVQDCNECHLDPQTKTITSATHATCVECHSAADETAPPGDGCLECHYTLTPKRAKRAKRPDYSLAEFDHEGHASVQCSACHGEVNETRLLTKITHPKMEDCLACHFPTLEHASSAQCGLCHLEITTQWKPANHGQANWERVHGVTSMNNPNLCSRCHDAVEFCQSCHQRERPSSHTATFRIKTHGFHAMSNPMSCQACHQQSFCEACHFTTEPMSHTASFKRKPYLHCAGCHLPLESGNRCQVCHKGDPHDQVIATPPPPRLVAAGLIDVNGPCLPCHPVDRVPITHPYNTISPLECVQCHRPI